MTVRKNVGGTDRLIRGVLGGGFLIISLVALVFDRHTIAVAAGLTGVGLCFNAVTQFCGINAILGLDTCSLEHDEQH